MGKRIIALFLLSMFMWNSIGYYVVFKIQQNKIRKAVKLKLKNSVPEEELVIFTFDPASEEYKQVIWIQPHEFRLRDQMFDIIKRNVDDQGNFVFHCINDQQEEILFANLEKDNQDYMASEGKNEKSGKLIKKVSQDFFFSETEIFSFLHDDKFHFIRVQNIFYNNAALKILTPPPQYLS